MVVPLAGQRLPAKFRGVGDRLRAGTAARACHRHSRGTGWQHVGAHLGTRSKRLRSLCETFVWPPTQTAPRVKLSRAVTASAAAMRRGLWELAAPAARLRSRRDAWLLRMGRQGAPTGQQCWEGFRPDQRGIEQAGPGAPRQLVSAGADSERLRRLRHVRAW